MKTTRATLFRAPLLLFLAAGCARGQAPSSAASASEPIGVQLLFHADTGGLSGADRAAVYAALGLVPSPDSTHLVDGVCGQRADAWLDYPDLNGDGTPEVRAGWGNACLSGHAGTSVSVFVVVDGRYRPQLGFPALSAEPLDTGNLGYPDLLIGGPGFCFPVYRWNGTEYIHLRDEPQEPGGCDRGPAA